MRGEREGAGHLSNVGNGSSKDAGRVVHLVEFDQRRGVEFSL